MPFKDNVPPEFDDNKQARASNHFNPLMPHADMYTTSAFSLMYETGMALFVY